MQVFSLDIGIQFFLSLQNMSKSKRSSGVPPLRRAEAVVRGAAQVGDRCINLGQAIAATLKDQYIDQIFMEAEGNQEWADNAFDEAAKAVFEVAVSPFTWPISDLVVDLTEENLSSAQGKRLDRLTKMYHQGDNEAIIDGINIGVQREMWSELVPVFKGNTIKQIIQDYIAICMMPDNFPMVGLNFAIVESIAELSPRCGSEADIGLRARSLFGQMANRHRVDYRLIGRIQALFPDRLVSP